MSKEEAIENIKKQIKNTKKANECGLATKGEFNEDIKSLEIVLQLIEEQYNKINKIRDYLRDMIKEERDFMKDLEHKNVAFHYANGRETLAKEILGILEE